MAKTHWFKKLAVALFCSIWLIGAAFGYHYLYGNQTAEAKTVITIGYQKGDIFQIAKLDGGLEKALEKENYTVKWHEFVDGSALQEALKTGSIDFGRTGNTPPVIAQSSGAQIVYAAAGYSKYQGSAILIPKNSTVKSVKALKGQKIAVAKGTSAHYFLIRALKKAGLTLNDVDVQYLDAGAARIAFEKGSVAAWVTWDPYTASAQTDIGAQILTTAEGYTTDRDFILSTKSFTTANPDVTKLVVSQTNKALKRANQNKSQLIKNLAKALKMDQATITLMVNRRTYGLESISTEILKEQQSIADTFYDLKLIKKKVDVQSAKIEN
ncbi:aliphatic sulfonate ABC transporter substrate-binding protein [Latilactobacillus fuchuensis]|uniref:Putative aliphatic sulfonates-binding protein n=1 Tax=Latilactobacillus fuchuensis TaxID=164393 RepID=A0A2N9DVM6_9LACO|nr:aliphatic sulfonate ABC transporter substrate-binding protein [Latilactobacillus fuchuensis]MCP8857121.1 aliphatic sulfonate ABC transporter substrate-binding protein [Latilactobacillus fuchuensis]SPC38549.1 Aliphatic sulfonates family ABC transporter, periplasmic ligand-binding protein [Latilactobacillus fuchuensis]